MNKFTKTIASIVAVVAFVAATASPASAYTFTRSLTVGSTGADVTELQTGLKAKGYLAVNPTGYFGNLTKAAVAAFQVANGVTPAVGYFGPLTQAKWNMVVTDSTTTTTTTTSNLSGTDGSISDVSELSQYSDEEVGEGEEDVKVAGFEVEASNDGDIALRSMKIAFDPAGNASGDSSHLDDYISGVKIWMGDKEVGSADVDEFKEGSDDVWTKTITLSNSVVEEDETEKFYISVDGANSFDSSDIDTDAWVVDVDNIRFEDGSGVVTTDETSDGMDVEIDFVSFGTASDTELKFSTDSSTPEAGTVIVDESDTTDDVVLTKGKIKVEGTSDVLLDELPVTLTVTGATDVDMVTGSLKLTIDGEEYTETVNTSSATSATVTFDNLDITLDAGKTYSFTVSADIENTDGDLDEGDTLVASVTSTNRDYVDAENEEGDQLSDSTEKSGTVTGEAQEFRIDGIQVTLVSTNTEVTTGNSSNDDLGTFKIKFKVKATGDTVYVASLAGTSGSTSSLFTVQKSGTATTGNTISGTMTDVSDDDLTTVGNYEVEDGSEETFELVVTAQLGAGGTGGQYRALLSSIKWNTDDSTTYTSYTSNLDAFKTSYIGLN